MTNTLTPAGAQLLRAARDQILAHPGEFDMNAWDCGTYACIGGWCERLMNKGKDFCHSDSLSELCGFGRKHATDTPLNGLMFYWSPEDVRNPRAAARRINAFLWQYGYPPNEVEAVDPASQQDAEDARATNAVREAADQPGVSLRA
jgi:hypothetical protein